MLTSVFFFILIELMIVAYADMMYRKIKNQWPILNILIYLVLVIFFPESYHFSIDATFYSIAIMAVGFVLFLLKIMGAGDTKYLATLFLLIPEYLQFNFFMFLVYSTFFVGSGMLIYNTVANRQKLLLAYMTRNLSIIKEVYGTKFTYAPVILLSWIWLGWESFTIYPKQ